MKPGNEIVLTVEVNTGECPRCKGASKIPNPAKSGPYLVDCPNCEGTGRVEVLQPMTEADLDDAVALGAELAQLRRDKESAKKAASDMARLFTLIGKGLERVELSPFAQQIRSFAAEGIASAQALIDQLAKDGGAQ